MPRQDSSTGERPVTRHPRQVGNPANGCGIEWMGRGFGTAQIEIVSPPATPPRKLLSSSAIASERESGTVTVLAHAHHDARRARTKCRAPRSDGHAAWRGGRRFDVREVHFYIRFARLGESVHGSQAAHGEAGRIDNVSIGRIGALVNVFENGPLKVGGEGRHPNACGSGSKAACRKRSLSHRRRPVAPLDRA